VDDQGADRGGGIVFAEDGEAGLAIGGVHDVVAVAGRALDSAAVGVWAPVDGKAGMAVEGIEGEGVEIFGAGDVVVAGIGEARAQVGLADELMELRIGIMAMKDDLISVIGGGVAEIGIPGEGG